MLHLLLASELAQCVVGLLAILALEAYFLTHSCGTDDDVQQDEL